MNRLREWLIRKLGGHVGRELVIKRVTCQAKKVYAQVTYTRDPLHPEKFDELLKDAIARKLIDELETNGWLRYDRTVEGENATLTGHIYVIEQPDEDILTFRR